MTSIIRLFMGIVCFAISALLIYLDYILVNTVYWIAMSIALWIHAPVFVGYGITIIISIIGAGVLLGIFILAAFAFIVGWGLITEYDI